ncbi:uncharacterized protein [Eucyclogobius newberryi]|uniref:uncharacterized protein n=1 Tax=Eucyclogobius newberryi TaxID=166745 RepID=UPI003B5BB056
MVLSASQQVALAFTAVLFTFVVLPRMFGVGGGAGGAGGAGGGSGAKDARLDSRYSRKGPGAVRGAPVHMNSPGAQSAENLQNMKTLMEQELKSDKYKSNSNKGYVFTLMPLYAIGVGVFAAYKFLKIKSADDQAQKEKLVKGAKKSVEAENQLNELEQRLAQTERMLNSILTQLDPITNCVKSVAQDQKNEIMNQLQTIRYLMKKRGMECLPLNVQDGSCERNLDSLIESLGANETLPGKPPRPMHSISEETVAEEQEKPPQTAEQEADDALEEGDETAVEEEEEQELEQEGAGLEPDIEEDIPLLEDGGESNVEEIGAAEPASGLRRRNRPE